MAKNLIWSLERIEEAEGTRLFKSIYHTFTAQYCCLNYHYCSCFTSVRKQDRNELERNTENQAGSKCANFNTKWKFK